MDSINASVIQKLAKRAERGAQKYGVTLDREDLDLRTWLLHLQEELLDAACYVERLMKETKYVPKDVRSHPEQGSREAF